MAIKGSSLDPQIRFQRFVAYQASECILWTGATSWGGYGLFSPNNQIGVKYAHRWIWEQTNGVIPGKLTIDHICLKRNCVNVNHMQLMSRAENASKARQVDHCVHGHEFTEENTYTDKRGKRQCRRCMSQRRTKGIRVPKEPGWNY